RPFAWRRIRRSSSPGLRSVVGGRRIIQALPRRPHTSTPHARDRRSSRSGQKGGYSAYSGTKQTDGTIGESEETRYVPLLPAYVPLLPARPEPVRRRDSHPPCRRAATGHFHD